MAADSSCWRFQDIRRASRRCRSSTACPPSRGMPQDSCTSIVHSAATTASAMVVEVAMIVMEVMLLLSSCAEGRVRALRPLIFGSGRTFAVRDSFLPPKHHTAEQHAIAIVIKVHARRGEAVGPTKIVREIPARVALSRKIARAGASLC